MMVLQRSGGMTLLQDAGKQTPMQSMKVNYLKSMKVNYLKGSFNETVVHVGTPDGLVKINQSS